MPKTIVLDVAHLKRLIHLCKVLSSGGGLTVPQLRVKLRTSRRTIFRNLNVLEEYGITVELGSKGYSIRQNLATCRKRIADVERRRFDAALRASLK